MRSRGASLIERLKAALQYPLPQHALSRLVWRVARAGQPRLKHWLIRVFIRRYGVDMSEAEQTAPDAYPSFNAFFTRALRAGARPIDAAANAVVSPVDGTVSQCGTLAGERLIQAKDRDFGLRELLGGDAVLAAPFQNGAFATLYLSPRDYHRVHMPLSGTLRHMLHVPGRLFSVNPATTRAVARLFARNERVAAIFETAAGPMAVVMVGALNVGSIETVWAGEITPPRGRYPRYWYYDEDRTVRLEKGAELGRFNLGSTVILLFGPDCLRWEPWLASGAPLRLGARIGSLR